MKTINLIIGITLGLVVLIFLEGIMTFGSAFNFENYDAFNYVFQSILIVLTVSISIKIVKETEK